MQISSSTQNAYTATTVSSSSKNSLTPQTDTVKQETSSLNKNAYNYVDLDEDISQYIEKNPVQDKTNEELVGFLTSFINDETPEGRRNLEGYKTNGHASKFDTDIVDAILQSFFDGNAEWDEINENQGMPKAPITQEILGIIPPSRMRELIKDMDRIELAVILGKDYIPSRDSEYSLEELRKSATIKIDEMERQSEEQKQSNYESTESRLVSIATDGHHFITDEESTKLHRERFKNLYSFSDEFSKTEKFEELYVKYKPKLVEKLNESYQPQNSFFENIDSAEYITSQVISNDLSKAEAIEYYENIVNEFKELLSQHKSYGASVKDDVQKTIDVYEKITEGLKEMWQFGDFDIRA